jgi:transposase
MRKITEVLRLKFEAKLSHDQIAHAVGLSKGVVGKYVSLAKAQELSWPLPEGMDEAALEARLYPPRQASTRFAEPDHARIHTELKRKGVTLQLLWSEYVAEAGERAYRYTQFCEHYRRWVNRQKRSMRQLHRAGEKLFIDYCGPTVPIVDATTGELRHAQVFVAVLGASRLHLCRGHLDAGAAPVDRLPSAGLRVLRWGGAVVGPRQPAQWRFQRLPL